MNIVSLILSFYIMTANLNTNQKNDLYMNITYTKGENSKDSNSQCLKINLNENILRYSITYGGFDPRKNKSQNYKVTEENEKKLILYIKEQILNTNIKEQISDVSPGININVDLELKIDNVITNAEISGALRPWGSEEYLKEQNKQTIENKDYVNKVNLLLYFLKFDLGLETIEIP